MSTGIIELVWTITSLVGALFAAYGVYDAVQDYWAVKHSTDRLTIQLGRTLIITESMRLTIQGAHFVLGVILIWNHENTVRFSAAIAILIGTGLLLMISTYLTLRIRLRISEGRKGKDAVQKSRQ